RTTSSSPSRSCAISLFAWLAAIFDRRYSTRWIVVAVDFIWLFFVRAFHGIGENSGLISYWRTLHVGFASRSGQATYFPPLVVGGVHRGSGTGGLLVLERQQAGAGGPAWWRCSLHGQHDGCAGSRAHRHHRGQHH